jgi:hypothetical protein
VLRNASQRLPDQYFQGDSPSSQLR